jgi:replicative DNA helicase
MSNNTNDNYEDSTTFVYELQSLERLHAELAQAARLGSLTHAIIKNKTQAYLAFLTPPDTRIAELSVQDLVTEYWERIKERKIAAPTGIPALDKVLGGGLQPKRLVTLLGAPGSGKTSLANQIADRVAEDSPVLYVTSEDGPDILLAKTLARLAEIPYSVALYGWDGWEQKINRGLAQLLDRPSDLRYLDVTSGVISLEDIRTRARAHFEGKQAHGLIVVDYLQRMARAIKGISGVELREAVTQLTEQLRTLACDLECTILAVASMNRASGYGKSTDALSSAKESGDIEYTSDVILALTDDPKRPERSDHQSRLLRIDKNRQGTTRCLKLDFFADRQMFTLASDEEEA